MNNIIKWIETPRKTSREFARTPLFRLTQFEQRGYKIYQHEEDFFMIERIKNKRSTICDTIETAEFIVEIALLMEEDATIYPSNPTTTVKDRSAYLVGKLDMLYNAKNGDKVRRKY